MSLHENSVRNSLPDIPRPEHPRPRFVRNAPWINLNGRWKFALDPGKSAEERGLASDPSGYDAEILVPFCPESRLSGLGHTDFIESCAYCREFTVPEEWEGYRTILHFDAADYHCRVFVDGTEAVRHSGGGTGFEAVLDLAPGSTHLLAALVRDDVRSGKQGGGKQCQRYRSFGCDYTRITGIWRTVWLEAAEPGALKSCRIQPNIDANTAVLTPEYYDDPDGGVPLLRITVSAEGRELLVCERRAPGGLPICLELPEAARLWSPEDPFLYDLRLEVLRGGRVADSVSTYFGMRKVHTAGNVFYLNNRPYFSRMVLDQGYDPEGLWTAPEDEFLRDCILKAKALGFNGARMHQKLFEDRYMYWADRLGFLLWSEYPSWGLDLHDAEARENFTAEWREAVLERVNHPSVAAWTPFNETFFYPNTENRVRAFPTPVHLDGYRQFMTGVYDLTRALDPSRPVCDSSGWYHAKTDLWTVHLYRQTGAELAADHADGVPSAAPEYEVPYSGQPYFIDEWGGFKFVPGDTGTRDESWGYGDAMTSGAELVSKIADQIDALMRVPGLQGYCYTQLMDIEQEQNGLLDASRRPKAPPEDFHRLFSRNPEALS